MLNFLRGNIRKFENHQQTSLIEPRKNRLSINDDPRASRLSSCLQVLGGFMTTRLSSSATHIAPTPKETNEGKLSPQHVERALYALHFDALVVQNAVDHTHLDTLNETMLKNAAYIASLGDENPYNYHKGKFPV